MLTLAAAIVEHSVRIMFFRHDGRGLPAQRNSTLYLLLFASVLARLLRDTLDPSGFSWQGSLTSTLAFIGLLHVIFRPAAMSALLLASMFTFVFTAALYLFGIANIYVSVGIWTWQGLATLVVLVRQVSRAKKERNTSSRKK